MGEKPGISAIPGLLAFTPQNHYNGPYLLEEKQGECMDSVMVIQLLTVILIGVVGFLTSRLYKSVDNLYSRTEDLKVEMEKKPNFEQAKTEAETVTHIKLLEHEANHH